MQPGGGIALTNEVVPGRFDRLASGWLRGQVIGSALIVRRIRDGTTTAGEGCVYAGLVPNA